MSSTQVAVRRHPEVSISDPQSDALLKLLHPVRRILVVLGTEQLFFQTVRTVELRISSRAKADRAISSNPNIDETVLVLRSCIG